MSTFTLSLQSSTQSEEITKLTSFVGEDASGKFGILPGSTRLMSCLRYGLSWLKYEDGTVEYLAAPGAILYFNENVLSICTRHYLRSHDYQTMVSALDAQLRHEEEELSDIKKSLQRLDREILKRLWEIGRREGYEL